MSAYSDWKAGLITDAEYSYLCRRDEYDERFQDETQWDDEEEVFEDDYPDEF